MQPPTRRVEGARAERVPRAAGGLDLRAVLAALNARQVNELLVECGPRLAGAFLGAGLVDELILYVAPQSAGRGCPAARGAAPVWAPAVRCRSSNFAMCGASEPTCV